MEICEWKTFFMAEEESNETILGLPQGFTFQVGILYYIETQIRHLLSKNL